MKTAVCVLVPSEDGKTFMSVSRRNDPTRWGLPGGKVDPGETPLQAIVRETFEEVGIRLAIQDLEPLLSAIVPGQCADDTFLVTTFLWTGSVQSLGRPRVETGLAMDWLTRDALMDPLRSPFAAYHVDAFRQEAQRLTLNQEAFA